MSRTPKLTTHAASTQKTVRYRFIAPILCLGLSMLIGLQVSTQFFAHLFSYHSSLGQHFYYVYWPWAIIDWGIAWFSQHQQSVFQSIAAGLGAMLFSLAGLLLFYRLKLNSSSAQSNLHGSARWANQDDIVQSGLLPQTLSPIDKMRGKVTEASKGVYVGGWQDKRGQFHYLRHDGPEHILTYAPTRSGKGVGLVVPTLLSWSHSCVITDLKGELWALTAGWRKQYANNKVLRFEPAAVDGSAKWNPLEEIRLGTPFEVSDTQNLVSLIVDPDGKGLHSHWQKTAFSLLVGVILHVLYTTKDRNTAPTLSVIDKQLSNPNQPLEELLSQMIQYRHENEQTHDVIASAAVDMVDRPPEEAGSVLSTAKSYLALFRDPIIADNTSQSDFFIQDLMQYDQPVSLYIITQPRDKTRLRPLVRILVGTIVRMLADKITYHEGRSVAHYKHRLLIMMDEFPSLGKLDVFQESLAFLAGYGIKCYLICQDINQLKSNETGYGHDESITSNCHIQNAYPPNRIETAEYLSRLTGQTTFVKEQITTSGHRSAMFMQHASRTYQEFQRPLLTPDECLRMPGPIKKGDDIEKAGDMIIYVAGYPAIYGKQPLYFNDPIFKARAMIAPPKHSDCIREPREASTESVA